MTAWTNDEKASLRAYLGFPSLFHDQNPRLENAINSVQQEADGGVLQDGGATQERMRTVMTSLASIDAKLEELWCTAFVKEAGIDNVKTDSIRAMQYLKMEGRRLIQQLAIPLGTRPMRDYYSPAEINNDPTGMSTFGAYSDVS